MDEKIILKWIIKEGIKFGPDSSGSGYGLAVGSSEQGNNASGFVKGEKVPCSVEFLKEDSTSWSFSTCGRTWVPNVCNTVLRYFLWL
jgi:hypothetical protein